MTDHWLAVIIRDVDRNGTAVAIEVCHHVEIALYGIDLRAIKIQNQSLQSAEVILWQRLVEN